MPSPLPQEANKDGLTFIAALQQAFAGKKIRRKDWLEDNPKDYGIVMEGRLKIVRDGKEFDWILSDGDWNNKDWEVC